VFPAKIALLPFTKTSNLFSTLFSSALTPVIHTMLVSATDYTTQATLSNFTTTFYYTTPNPVPVMVTEFPPLISK